MQVRDKLFPYPVINHNKIFSNYKEAEFELVFEQEENESAYILKNVRLTTTSGTLSKLILEEKVGVRIIVECSDTVFRKAFDVTSTPKDLILSKMDFTERVDISMFAYAKTQFDYISDEIEEDYKNIVFTIDKYDILGVYDGFNVRFKHDETEGSFVQSIFYVDVDEDLEPGKYKVECNIGKRIAIYLAREDFDNYKIIYAVPAYMEVFFNLLLVPSLIEGLSLCKLMLDDPSKDLDDVGNTYLWFRSIQSSYKKLKGHELTLEDFKNLQPSELAQDLLGKPLGSSLKKLIAEMNEIGGSEDE